MQTIETYPKEEHGHTIALKGSERTFECLCGKDLRIPRSGTVACRNCRRVWRREREERTIRSGWNIETVEEDRMTLAERN